MLWPDPEAEGCCSSSSTASTRVDHTRLAEAVTALGRDNECRALSRAVGWHTQNRTLLDGGRIVIFDDHSRGDNAQAKGG